MKFNRTKRPVLLYVLAPIWLVGLMVIIAVNDPEQRDGSPEAASMLAESYQFDRPVSTQTLPGTLREISGITPFDA
ncbi:MAG: hypothetical protein AAFN81_35630, partial [Bacteroidota bacterium]